MRAAPSIYSSLVKSVLSQGREPWMTWKGDENEFSRPEKKSWQTPQVPQCYIDTARTEYLAFYRTLLCYIKHRVITTGVTWLITLIGGGGTRSNVGMRNSGAPILGYVKCRCFTSLSLHHPYNRFRNISIIYMPLFNQVAKKTIVKKILKGDIHPPCTPTRKLGLWVYGVL